MPGRRRALLNQADLAEHFGVTPGAIAQAVRRGEIIPEPTGLIDVKQAEATYGRRRALRATERAKNRENAARHVRATLTRAVAGVQIMRRKAEQLHDRLIERDACQTEISDIATASLDMLHANKQRQRIDIVAADCVRFMASDLGDLHSEALKVLRSND